MTYPAVSHPDWFDVDRARSESQANAVRRIGCVTLEADARRVSVDDHELTLTTMEYEVAARLIQAAGRVVSRDEMMPDAFGRDASPVDRALDVHISHLRRKFGAHRWLIVTVRGVGYMFRVETPRAPHATP